MKLQIGIVTPRILFVQKNPRSISLLIFCTKYTTETSSFAMKTLLSINPLLPHSRLFAFFFEVFSVFLLLMTRIAAMAIALKIPKSIVSLRTSFFLIHQFRICWVVSLGFVKFIWCDCVSLRYVT